MNPQASEFVPSWLPKTVETSGAGSAPVQSHPQAEEPPDTWDEDDAPASADTAALGTITEGASPDVDALGDSVAKFSVKKDEDRNGEAVVNDRPPQDPAIGAPLAKGVAESRPSASPQVPNAEEAIFAELEPSLGTDARKPFNVVLLGHVDAGKSTISGHILYLTGNVDERTMEKYEREAKALNRESWKFAWALDTSDQERAKGKTEEYGQAAFNTETRRFTILDAPGHKNYVPHMIGGASQADIGILVISARKGEFETGFERGGQTREHAMLAKTSGVRMLIVVINKLDDPSVLNPDETWSQERYDECKKGLEPYLRTVGWNLKEITWIPVSGLQGDNLKVRATEKKCPWYQGVTLLECLEKINLPDRLMTGPVMMPISEKHKEMGTMVKGKLESGLIRLNDKLVMMPNGVDVVVDAVELEGSESTTAVPGDNVRLRLKGIDEEDIRAGFVLCSPSALVHFSNCFDAQLVILEHRSILCAGYSAVMHVHQVEVECTLERLLAEIDKKTGKIAKKNPKFVKPGMKCIVRVQTQQPICIEPYKAFPQLGRFMLRDEGRTIAVGVVLKVRLSNGADVSEAAGVAH